SQAAGRLAVPRRDPSPGFVAAVSDRRNVDRRSTLQHARAGGPVRIQDLHVLPKFSDGWSYLYVEHCRVDQEERAIAVHDQAGKVPVPCANLALLMLGPGVSITHAAISVLADHGCLVAWCGEEGVRFYAVGMGETRSAANFLHQA